MLKRYDGFERIAEDGTLFTPSWKRFNGFLVKDYGEENQRDYESDVDDASPIPFKKRKLVEQEKIKAGILLT